MEVRQTKDDEVEATIPFRKFWNTESCRAVCKAMGVTERAALYVYTAGRIGAIPKTK